MLDKYILVNKKPVKEPDTLKWAKWFEKADRHVKRDSIGDVEVSTVFLSLDHNFSGGKPLLFETMIFGGKHDQYQDRCSTWKEAEEMHKKAINKVKED